MTSDTFHHCKIHVYTSQVRKDNQYKYFERIRWLWLFLNCFDFLSPEVKDLYTKIMENTQIYKDKMYGFFLY